MLESLGNLGSRLKEQFDPDLRQKVKNGLVKKYMAEKKDAKKKKQDDKIQETVNKQLWKVEKSKYKSKKKDAIQKISEVHMKLWEDETQAKANVREQNGTNEDIKKVEQEYKDKKAQEIEDKFNETLFNPLTDYIKAA